MLTQLKFLSSLKRSVHLRSRLANKLESTKTLDTLNDKLRVKLFQYMSIYEETIGIKEIKLAQDAVLDAERNFLHAQNERRELNCQLIEAQQKLRDLRDEMDRLARTDARYLKLFTEEHSLLQQESKLVDEYKLKESKERDLFFYLSAALRDSQEKERIRVERTKYLQLGLSILCTSLGIFSAWLLSYIRNANIREILNYDKEEFENMKKILAYMEKEQASVNKDLNLAIDLVQNKLEYQKDMIAKLIMAENKEYNEQKVVLSQNIFYPTLVFGLIILGSILFNK